MPRVVRVCFTVGTLMLTEALHRIANHRESLSKEEAREVMSHLLSGKATDAQIGALLVALHMKGEMRSSALRRPSARPLRRFTPPRIPRWTSPARNATH